MSSTTSPPTKIRVALDWTPNTLHSGLFLAQHHNLYSSHNLSVELITPDPSYTTTPAKLVRDGKADLCLCPSESVIAYAEGKDSASQSSFRLQAIYAICATDASAIAARSDRATRPADLGAKALTYGSYDARYEDDIVRAMIAHDGGSAERLKIRGAPDVGKLDLFSAVMEGEPGGVDATWIFTPWEGIEAEIAQERDGGVELSLFVPGKYGVPYGYSPVIARAAGAAAGVSEEALGAFVKATREGYVMAMKESEKGVEVLSGKCRPERSDEFLSRSQKAINEFYGEAEKLGMMEKARWEGWVRWLEGKGLLKEGRVEVGELFTNECFEHP